jgi:rare lipoprotein A
LSRRLGSCVSYYFDTASGFLVDPRQRGSESSIQYGQMMISRLPSIFGARCSRAERTGLARLPLLLLSGCVLGVAGCHHQQQVAYQPPPPPLRPGTSTAHSAARPLSPESTPSIGFDDTSGKPVLTQFGTASWYGPPYHHHAAADGSIFDQNAMTAAHRTLPMGSTIRVTNVATNQAVLVRITDRGPFVPGRILDLSLAAAKQIGVYAPGTAQVKVEAFAHPSANPAGKWCVQIGVFKRANDALDLQAALTGQYRTAKVTEFAGATGFWVRINPALPDLAHANEVARSVQPRDPAALPYVVRID